MRVPTWATFDQLHQAIKIAFDQDIDRDWKFEVRDTENWTIESSTAATILKIYELSYGGPGRKSANMTTLQDILDDDRYARKVMVYVGDGLIYTITGKGSASCRKMYMTPEGLSLVEQIMVLEGAGRISSRKPHHFVQTFQQAEKDAINQRLSERHIPLPAKDRAELIDAFERKQHLDEKMEYQFGRHTGAGRIRNCSMESREEIQQLTSLRSPKLRRPMRREMKASPLENQSEYRTNRKRSRGASFEMTIEDDRPSSRRIRLY